TSDNKVFIKQLVRENYNEADVSNNLKVHEKNLMKTEASISSPSNVISKNRRCGTIARKIGEYPLWLNNGEKIRTTLLQIIDNHIISYIPPEKYSPAHFPNVKNVNKFGCLLVGAGNINPIWLTKEYCGIFHESSVMPKKMLARFLVSPESALHPGTSLNVAHYRVGEFVDVRGKTIDYGFQGVVKRFGFKGMPASHGVTKTHRRAGNIGGGGEKGRVWPGTKMPGRMGSRWRINKGLQVLRTSLKYNVMWVQGSAVPGPTGGIVYLYDTILPHRKKKISSSYENIDKVTDDIWSEKLHSFKDIRMTHKNE
ncbi:hypothetical protein KR067_001874, partial [Drosophila pandora]